MKRYFQAVCWAVLMVLMPSSVEATLVADAAAEFPPNVPNPNPGNPFGTWSYGFKAPPTTAGAHPTGNLTLFNEYTSSANGYGWRPSTHSLGAPLFAVLTNPVFGLSAGDSALHGGPNNEFAVIRFTVLTPGLYDLKAPWKPGDGSEADLYLQVNDVTLAFTPSTNLSGALTAFNVPLLLGDVVDLALGTGGDSFFGDSTGANLQIFAAVPEVGSFLGMSAAALVFGVGFRVSRSKGTSSGVGEFRRCA